MPAHLGRGAAAVHPPHDRAGLLQTRPMKLASLKGGRDGRLVVVSRDLTAFADAGAIAPTLQAALDDWARAAPQLAALAQALERGEAERRPFDERAVESPLPRAYQWADGSAYLN